MLRKRTRISLIVAIGTSVFLSSWEISRAAAPEPVAIDGRQTRAKSFSTSLPLIPGRGILRDLEAVGRFHPARAFYAGHMGRAYDEAMAVVSKPQHYLKLGDQDVYLDPTTEAHESLHAMSSLIRSARGWSVDQGYDVIYVGKDEFAAVRVAPDITKHHVGAWLPRGARSSEVVKTHIEDPVYSDGHVVLVVEELAYHLLDARIGLENHSYMDRKLGLSNAVTVPAADWSVVALATAAMLDSDPRGFRKPQDRAEFNALVKRLVEESAAVYAEGMNGRKYGRMANLAPELRSRFTYLCREDSRQAARIRDFCAKAFDKTWLPGLVERVERARESTEAFLSRGIYNP